MTKKGRVFSGARPTGRQHIGNYLGAIKNYVDMQEDYDCVYCIVDLHALTTLETTKDLRQNTLEMAWDWLAAGMDPNKSIIFVQSMVKQVTELHTILSMVTPLGKLTDLPTFKEKVRDHPHNVNYGLVGYPVLQAADITLYKTNFVPVGIDQVPHIEFTRECVRSFNYLYNTTVLIEPQAKITQFPKILGTDGVNKMSKSLNNDIELAATADETSAIVMKMVTDPQRLRRTDPGDPDVCNVFSLHKVFSQPDEVENINVECRKAGIGCVDCKKLLAKNMNDYFAPLRAKREEFAKDESGTWDMLRDGAKRAEVIAEATMAEVRAAVGLPK
ncbi:MAG: tryptophan--tRNA ligase [Chloroflexi bacterium HGW-Chloroflexi-4]|jgi:tryptophanyl-tRNA synthetase|nr:MAG: tryptophan--tRNA ligase [Chloroflexi bacterium HGW-Chloroflexi-4]